MKRIAWSLAAVGMMFAMVAGVFTARAGTASAHALAASRPTVVHHDMSHPMKANYPCPGTPHGGIAKLGTPSPVFTCSQSQPQSGQISPYAGNESGNCKNGVTYLQTLSNGHGQLWAWTSDTNTYNTYTSQMNGWIEYFWCPAANSSQYPNGINYSYGELWPTTKQSNGTCPTMSLGGAIYHAAWWETFGAEVVPGSAGNGVGDAQTYQSWSICPGNYVWDYSYYADGTYTWVATMWTGSTDDMNTAATFSVAWPYAR